MTLFKKEIVPSTEKEAVVYASAAGKILELDKVPNAAISSGILGDGFGIKSEGGKVIAPIEGRIRDISDMGRTISMKGKDGLKILVNIDCGNREDELMLQVAKGDIVEAGVLFCETGEAVISVVFTCGEQLSMIETRSGKVKLGDEAAVYRLRPQIVK